MMIAPAQPQAATHAQSRRVTADRCDGLQNALEFGFGEITGAISQGQALANGGEIFRLGGRIGLGRTLDWRELDVFDANALRLRNHRAIGDVAEFFGKRFRFGEVERGLRVDACDHLRSCS